VFKEPLRKHAVGFENGDRLWALSEKLVGEEFGYRIRVARKGNQQKAFSFVGSLISIGKERKQRIEIIDR
jgi:hypothetical protein